MLFIIINFLEIHSFQCSFNDLIMTVADIPLFMYWGHGRWMVYVTRSDQMIDGTWHIKVSWVVNFRSSPTGRSCSILIWHLQWQGDCNTYFKYISEWSHVFFGCVHNLKHEAFMEVVIELLPFIWSGACKCCIGENFQQPSSTPPTQPNPPPSPILCTLDQLLEIWYC
jgi:hypothetical protein